MADFETPRLRDLARIRAERFNELNIFIEGSFKPKRRSIISSVGSN